MHDAYTYSGVGSKMRRFQYTSSRNSMKVTRIEINKTRDIISGFVYALKKIDLLDDKGKEAYLALNMPWYTSWTAKIKTLPLT